MQDTTAVDDDQRFLRMAIELARDNLRRGGRPFGAVVVKDGEPVAQGVNAILATGDPTSHAELNAIRAASQALGSPDLAGCAVYASGQPCPMCLAAMRMAGIAAVRFAWSNADAEPYGLSTAAIAADLARPLAEQSMDIRHQAVRAESEPSLYAQWRRQQG